MNLRLIAQRLVQGLVHTGHAGARSLSFIPRLPAPAALATGNSPIKTGF